MRSAVSSWCIPPGCACARRDLRFRAAKGQASAGTTDAGVIVGAMLADGPVQVGCRPEAEPGGSMTIRIIGSGMKGQGIMRVLFQVVESCARCRYGEPVGLNLAEDASVTCTAARPGQHRQQQDR